MPLGTAAVTGIVGAIGIGAGASAASKDREQGQKALDEQKSFNAGNRDFLAKKIDTAGKQAETLFELSGKNRTTGAQRSLEILGQTIPQQLSAFQQGNVGAQEQLLAGLPQVQNALLGLPVDLSGLQPRQIPVDASFAQQQLPGFTTPISALRNRGLSATPVRNPNVVGAGFFDLPESFGNFGSTFQPF